MATLRAEYMAAGANRHPSTSDWWGGVLAFGTGRNVGIWNLGVQETGEERKMKGNGRGISVLLVGHTDSVNAVKFLQTSVGLLLLTGSVDKTVRVWQSQNSSDGSCSFECIQLLDQHQSSVNSIAVTSGAEVFATGDAGATVKTWKVDVSETGITVNIQQSIQLTPRFFPLALALHPLHESSVYVLAVAGTTTIVQLYVAESLNDFKLKATLTGHEGWIRSLSFTYETTELGSDLLLASASQDKYIRLWRIHQGKKLPAAAAVGSDLASGAFLPGKSLSNKAHRFIAGGQDYSATFEALLLGHEDWIYSAAWRQGGKTLQLLSASADNSLAIWEQDSTTGVWVSITRLGEISGQKGSTTATGSTGGFWTGLWSPSGTTVACIGRTGSFRIWNYNADNDRWIQGVAISGHIAPITGIAWSRSGSYLLSTSSDQTTRLHAQWKREGHSTWHEVARPQIHGYDLNCIDTLGETSFVSGADEKLLRVFNMPKAVAGVLQNLNPTTSLNSSSLPDSANMPVLGLSNKTITEPSPPQDEDSSPPTSAEEAYHPPLEDHLSKSTLFPEIEKLYGHGYEISCLATSPDGTVLATACRATSLDHAVIRLYSTRTWRELKPPLKAHSLTVTRLRFQKAIDDSGSEWLLSIGRDRMWAVWRKPISSSEISSSEMEKDDQTNTEEATWTLLQHNPKSHSRMLLDASWSPGSNKAFITAGRDKMVRFWCWEDDDESDESKSKSKSEGDKNERDEKKGAFHLKNTLSEETPITSISFSDRIFIDDDEGKKRERERAYLALGGEGGRICVWCVGLGKGRNENGRDGNGNGMVVLERFVLDESSCPSRAITELAWRPRPEQSSIRDGLGEKEKGEVEEESLLAVASEDFSLRVLSLRGILSMAAKLAQP